MVAHCRMNLQNKLLQAFFLTTEASNRYSRVMRWKISFFMLLTFLVIFLGIAYWLIPKGYFKAIILAPQTINMQVTGMLEQKSNNSWTLVKNNKKITITNDSTHSPNYLRRPQYKGQQPETIDSDDVIPGISVTISLTIDPQSDKLTVTNIIVD